MAVASHAKTWLKRYFDDSNFPEWTKSNVGITIPLSFPERSEPCSEEKTDVELTPCLFCEDTWPLPSHQRQFVRHLADVHQFFIRDVTVIPDLPAYVSYWKAKFENSVDVSEYLVKSGRDQYHLHDRFSEEDKELRIQLQMRRLEKILDIHEKERNDKQFSRGCLFCRMTFEGDPKPLFDHMAFDHNFSVGQPDNLVFIRELLDLLEKKLDEMTCIYCEKVFKNREVLKEHMRKKSHKKINPKNKAYDKFYLVNYLEFGKTWRSGGNDELDGFDPTDQDELPTGFDSDIETEEDWGDWKGFSGGAVCLFCDVASEQVVDLLRHMIVVHDFDFEALRVDNEFTFYQQVKLINYIRRQVHLLSCIHCDEKFSNREQLMSHMTEAGHMKLPDDKDEWDQSQYFFPTYENDNFLYSLEVPGSDDKDDNDEEEEEEIKDKTGLPEDCPPVVPEDCPVKNSILSEDEFRESLLPRHQRKKQ